MITRCCSRLSLIHPIVVCFLDLIVWILVACVGYSSVIQARFVLPHIVRCLLACSVPYCFFRVIQLLGRRRTKRFVFCASCTLTREVVIAAIATSASTDLIIIASGETGFRLRVYCCYMAELQLSRTPENKNAETVVEQLLPVPGKYRMCRQQCCKRR